MVRRKNTFRIDYAALPKKPDYVKVQSFVRTVLGLKPGEVTRIQCSRTLGCAFVKVIDLALAKKVCEEHDGKHEVTVEEGRKIPLRITMEDGAVEVKLYDLSEAVSNESITKFLSQYGEVISVQEQMCAADEQLEFPGISTGVWVAKMIVKHNIESWVLVDGEWTYLSYYGQRQTCRHCREFMHTGVSCVQNKKLLVQKSYADATKQPAKINTKKQTPNPTMPGPSTSSRPPAKKKKQQQPQLPSSLPDMQSEKQFPSLIVPIIPISQPSGSRLLTSITGQQPSVDGEMEHRPDNGKPDGNETDESVISTNSKTGRRRKNKKRRNGSDGGDERDNVEGENGGNEMLELEF